MQKNKAVNLLFYILFLAASCPLWAEGDTVVEHVIETKYEYVLAEGTQIEVENFIGTLTIQPSDGPRMQLIASTHAFSDQEARAKELATKLHLDVSQKANTWALKVNFPVDQHSLYYYPITDGSKKGLSKGRFRTNYRGKEVTIFTDKTPAAVHLFAEIVLKVPKGMQLTVHNEVGSVAVVGFAGTMDIETGLAAQHIGSCSGTIAATSNGGDITIDTSSGTITCLNAAGKVSCKKMQSDQEVYIQTGSGHVQCDGCTLKALCVQTGSGAIELEKSNLETIQVETGSGRVELSDTKVVQAASIHTGSGQIKVKGDLSRLKTLDLATGSGRIECMLTPFPPLQFNVHSGKAVKVQVASLKVPRGTLRSFVGSTVEQPIGEATIVSGSGQIKLSTKDEK